MFCFFAPAVEDNQVNLVAHRRLVSRSKAKGDPADLERYDIYTVQVSQPQDECIGSYLRWWQRAQDWPRTPQSTLWRSSGTLMLTMSRCNWSGIDQELSTIGNVGTRHIIRQDVIAAPAECVQLGNSWARRYAITIVCTWKDTVVLIHATASTGYGTYVWLSGYRRNFVRIYQQKRRLARGV